MKTFEEVRRREKKPALTLRIFLHPSILHNVMFKKKKGRKKKVGRRTNTQLLLDPSSSATLLVPRPWSRERSRSTFLTPDGFVPAPWKPHTAPIGWRSEVEEKEEEEQEQQTQAVALAASFASRSFFLLHNCGTFPISQPSY